MLWRFWQPVLVVMRTGGQSTIRICRPHVEAASLGVAFCVEGMRESGVAV